MSGLIENPKLYSTVRVGLLEKEGEGWGEQLEFHDIKAWNGDVISIRLYHGSLPI